MVSLIGYSSIVAQKIKLKIIFTGINVKLLVNKQLKLNLIKNQLAMISTFSLDPSFGIAKAFIKIAMVFCAVMVAILVYMVYLTYLGFLADWDLSLHASMGVFQPEANSIGLQMAFFTFPAIGFIISFILLGWLGKKIQLESQS